MYRNEKYVFKYFRKTFSNTFFKYIVSINISVSRSHVMPARLITFTANHQTNCFQASKYPLKATLLSHQTVLPIEEDTSQQVSLGH